MSNIEPQLRHDFINNSLRLEVLSKLICKDLEKETEPNNQYISDFDKFLHIEINLLKELKDHFHVN